MTTKDTGIMVQDETGALVSWEDFAGEGFDDGTESVRASFGTIKIVQGTSTMPGAGKHGGDFWLPDSETYVPALDCVALAMRETRAYFKEGDDKPCCISLDGKTPLADQPLWRENAQGGYASQPDNCGECPWSAWEGSFAPPCKNSLVLLLDRGDEGLAQLRVSGKSIKPWRKFVARACKPGSRIAKPLCAFKLRLTTEELSDTGKKWHELRVEGTLMSRADAQPYMAALATYQTQFAASLHNEATAEAAPAESWESV